MSEYEKLKKEAKDFLDNPEEFSYDAFANILICFADQCDDKEMIRLATLIVKDKDN
jgi:hypothetical protein